MKIVKTFKNKELLTFTEDNYQNQIKIYIDDNYHKFSIKKGYKMNLINSNKGSYKGSFMNNYICKKFISNQKLNLINIETNKILNYCQYFLLSKKDYVNLKLDNNYKYFWFLRSSWYDFTKQFNFVHTSGIINYGINAYWSIGFVPFFLKKVKNENNENF